ncbi:MAG: hypothetical protein K6F56_02120 [Oscillospiraceae bacterium]|nr:hypothetical protein [Oscillospiraceae bacterium]
MDYKELFDEELMDLFRKVAKKNGTTAELVLSNFIKDYIVSGGHPEHVGDKRLHGRKA